MVSNCKISSAFKKKTSIDRVILIVVTPINQCIVTLSCLMIEEFYVPVVVSSDLGFFISRSNMVFECHDL